MISTRLIIRYYEALAIILCLPFQHSMTCISYNLDCRYNNFVSLAEKVDQMEIYLTYENNKALATAMVENLLRQSLLLAKPYEFIQARLGQASGRPQETRTSNHHPPTANHQPDNHHLCVSLSTA